MYKRFVCEYDEYVYVCSAGVTAFFFFSLGEASTYLGNECKAEKVWVREHSVGKKYYVVVCAFW